MPMDSPSVCVEPRGERLLQELKKEMKKRSSRKRAEMTQRFFKTGKGMYGEGDRFVGIRVPILRELAKAYRDLEWRACCELLSSSIHEERLIALFLFIHHYERGGEDTRQEIVRTYLASAHFVNNWDLVDVSADKLVGRFLEKRSKKPLFDLARSSLIWERRIAIVATFWLIRHGVYEPTLKIAKILLRDSEDLIQKAVGWMLREIGKRSGETLEEFLDQYAAHMPRTMLRYAIERFPEEQRRGYLRVRRMK